MARKLKPIEVGQRFGRLKYVEEAGFNSKRRRIALFNCDCGNETIAVVDNVKHGITKSCGCIPKSGRNKEPLNGKGNKKKSYYTVGEGIFDIDAYLKSDFILQS